MTWLPRFLKALGLRLECSHARRTAIPPEKKQQLAEMEQKIAAASQTHSRVSIEVMKSNFKAQDRFSEVSEAVRGVVTLLEKKPEDG